jgi:Na+/H+-translocating membrane pyrophosphatase
MMRFVAYASSFDIILGAVMSKLAGNIGMIRGESRKTHPRLLRASTGNLAQKA